MKTIKNICPICFKSPISEIYCSECEFRLWQIYNSLIAAGAKPYRTPLVTQAIDLLTDYRRAISRPHGAMCMCHKCIPPSESE